jgi:protein TonB
MEAMSTGALLGAGIDARMQEIPSLVKAGEHLKAMNIVHDLKQAHPKNIFLIALEKQLEKIIAFASDHNLLDPERQQELLQSLPGLIQRASEQLAGEQPAPPPSPALAEREAAFKKLKTEYFHLADRHIDAGEYQEALQEIKRVLILDPANAAAHEYQQKIQFLIESAAARAAGKSAAREVVRNTTPPPAPQREKRPPEPAREPVVAPAPPRIEDRTESIEKKRSFPIIAFAAAVLILAGGGVAYHLMGTEDVATSPQQAVAEQQSKKPVQSPVVEKPVQAATITPVEQKETPQEVKNEPTITPVIEQAKPKDDPAPRKSIESTPVKQEPLLASKSEPKPELKVKKEETADNATPTKPTTKIEEPAKKVETAPPPMAKAEVRSETPPRSAEAVSQPIATFAERKPEIIKLENPKFPLAAQRVGLEGEVVVRALIGVDGKVARAEILRSSNDVFNDAVLTAVNQSRFSPGVKSTGPAETWITIPFRFKSKK